MASQPESKIPGPGGGGREKRRSFLPAPKRSSGIPSPSSSTPVLPNEAPVLPLVKQPVAQGRESPKDEPVVVKEVIPGAEKLTVGKRILISGVKPGILRFVGKTHIAPGFWCGIELFDASGLHDGEVDGTRYFTCKPFRGIFAPLDKVDPDESYRSPAREKTPQVEEKKAEAKHEEKPVSETEKKSPDNESSKIPAPPRSQIARLTGIPRIGSGSQERGVVKSTSADGIKESGSRIATFSKRSSYIQDANSGSHTGLNSTFVLDGKQTTRRSSEDSDENALLNQTFSCGVEKHLQSDSRQYLNITFNKDNPAASAPTSNLPDVVSSTSPSPPRETVGRAITGSLNQTQNAQDIASNLASDIISSSVASDVSLGLMEPDIIAEETNLLEGILSERVGPSTSESDVSLSGNSSTLEDTSVATVNEVIPGPGLTSTPLHGADLKKFVEENGETLSDNCSDADSVKSAGEKSTAAHIKQTLARTLAAAGAGGDESAQRKDSSSSVGGVSAVRADLLQEEGSNGVSPEVSQVLEWDYDHDAFDGKLLLEKCHDGMSTSTSDSCSEASADHGAAGVLADKGGPDLDGPAQDGDEAHPFEENEDGFESIDNIEDFPLGMSKETHHMMTDSGISEKGFLEPLTDAASKRKSVEFDSKVNVVDVPAAEGDSGATVERRRAADATLQKDLMEGHAKQERPLSLVSTTSADTGYVPDTDSEAGTLTTNSPTDWTEKQLNANPSAGTNLDPRQRGPASVKSKQSLMGRGLPGEPVKEVETDSDICSDAGTAMVEVEGPSDVDDQEKTACQDVSEESEDEEEEDDSEEEETSSEEEEEEDDSEEDEEDEEEVEDDDRPEDDRIEADRAPATARSQAAAAVTTGVTASTLAPNQANGMGSDMTESCNLATMEQTPSANTAGVANAARAPGSGGSAAAAPGAKPEAAGVPGDAGAKKAGTDGGNVSASKKKKKSAAASSPTQQKIVSEHKKAVKAASSRLADYIKAPPPPAKPKEEKATSKNKKSKAGEAKKNKGGGKKADNSAGTAADKPKGDNGEEKREKKATPVKEEKPKVKRAPPKSKWGNIMSQIEASKDTIKVKPKSEIKSSLAVYLSTPPPTNLPPKKDGEKDASKQKEENQNLPKAKPKSKLVNHPKPDFSNIKSRLNVASPPRPPNSSPRETSSSPSLGSAHKDNVKAHKDNVKASKDSKASPQQRKTSPTVSRLKEDLLVADHQETLENCSIVSQGTGSHTDITALDGVDAASTSGAMDKKRNTISCGPRIKHERTSSVTSSKSDISSAQRSVKTMNLRNAKKSEGSPNNSVSPSKKSSVKSSIPPPNQGRSRFKSSGLKSGQPPDVVSTSARGTRAQEVARLESLCEARTKELNYTKMQLKAGLQAFDAMTCLLSYCTNQLDAFSCPAITAKLQTAEGKIAEQQQNLECITQQKSQLEQQLQEVSSAKDAALQEVEKLKQEMTQAEEAHSAAQQQLREEHADALKASREELTSHHQKNMQQIQHSQDRQMEYVRHSQKRQMAELNSEHQMFTNQLKLAHLEEIQELRNKHDLQMEELHAQHRNKLEDITHRFESIKLSLSEKVQSLCVECDELRIRAKTSEEALQRDADAKVQLALSPYLHLPKEIESLRMVVDMRTEEIQKLRRQNMDLEKQLEELPIAQEKVASLQQKVENLQAIINIKTDHEKQLHEKCQVLMRKYDRESRANKRLSMDYEQVVWRMSQSADLTGSMESLSKSQLSHSPGRDQHDHSSPSPVRRTVSNSSQGGEVPTSPATVTRRQRKISGGEEDFDRKIRCRSATFSLDKNKAGLAKSDSSVGVNGTSSTPGSPSKGGMSKSGDYTDMIMEAMNAGHDESFSSGHESDFLSSMESSVILETPQGVSFNINVVENGGVATEDGASAQDEVFTEEQVPQMVKNIPMDLSAQVADIEPVQPEVTVVVNSPTSD